MSTNQRDTHFAGFARLLADEVIQAFLENFQREDLTRDDVTQIQLQVITRRVYDLIIHILMNAPTSSLQHCCSRLEAESCIEDIPDMPELPKKVQE